MEAFSDGVLAIVITVMVLELRIPAGSSESALRSVWPGLLCYVLSFVNIGIYWNNHHHLLKTVERITGGVLWANLGLLFWLSLLPIATAWMSRNHFAALPVAVYGCVLLCAGVSYYVLERAIIAASPGGSRLAAAVGRDAKGVVSIGIYAVAIAVCVVSRWIAFALYVAVAIMWLVPDRRLAPSLEDSAQAE
jgi:TMEM175 potassium channel family protein